MTNEFKHKRIFVTGGTGSIGWQIVRELVSFLPKEIVVYSRDEGRHAVYSRAAVESGFPVRFVIGDVRDRDRLQSAMRGSDIVFHTAALKHVDLCEQSPYEAIQTNALGTQHVVDAAIANKVRKVIVISTDKAADASNVLGITKRLAEKIALLGNRAPDSVTRISCVRFGNVLGSRGSVVPLFVHQIQEQGRITVTDPSMTRFFMSLPQAVELILKSVANMRGGEIFILKMPAVRLGDLARAIIAAVRDCDKKVPRKVTINVVGKRPGERLHEKLLTEDESRRSLETDDLFIVFDSEEEAAKNASRYPHAAPPTVRSYESDKVKPLPLQDIVSFVAPLVENEIRAVNASSV